MKYALVIAPHELTEVIASETKRIGQGVYVKEIKGVYYRVQTTKHQKNPRRVIMNGNGEILEFNVKPQINFVQDLEISEEKASDFIHVFSLQR